MMNYIRTESDYRLQMWLNFHAVCAQRGFSLATFHVERDRVWCLLPSEEILDAQLKLDKSGLIFERCPPSGHTPPPIVFSLLKATSAMEIRNYRGRIPGTFAGDQWVVYRLNTGSILLEMDLDEESPIDVLPTIVHWGRLLWRQFTNAKTNPFRMAAVLRKGGIDVKEV